MDRTEDAFILESMLFSRQVKITPKIREVVIMLSILPFSAVNEKFETTI